MSLFIRNNYYIILVELVLCLWYYWKNIDENCVFCELMEVKCVCRCSLYRFNCVCVICWEVYCYVKVFCRSSCIEVVEVIEFILVGCMEVCY